MLFPQCDDSDDIPAPLPELINETWPVSLNGIPCAPDSSSYKLYCPIPAKTGTDINARFSYYLPDKQLYIDGVPYTKGRTVKLADWKTTPHTLRIDDEEQEWQLILTTLPLVCLNTAPEINKEELTTGEFTLIDPLKRTCNTTRFTQHAGIRIRGGSSTQYAKKSYAVEFWLPDTDTEVDISVLGMRSDDDLILDAMYIDHARMRNRVCTDLWNTFDRLPYSQKGQDDLNGTQGTFVEVLLNGTYNGLYCLTDKIDRKKLQLKKTQTAPYSPYYSLHGILYKSTSWTAATTLSGYAIAPEDDFIWQGWEQKYPDEQPECVSWQPLKSFIDYCSPYSNFHQHPDMMQELSVHVYTENLIDYILLSQLMYMEDNLLKNIYLSCRDIVCDRRFLLTPWDMDMSFGRDYAGRKHSGVPFSQSLINQCTLFRNLITYGHPDFRHALRSRWDELKHNQLSVENVSRQLITYRDLFEQSGTWKREWERWPECMGDLDEEVEYMIETYRNNVEAADHFLSNF